MELNGKFHALAPFYLGSKYFDQLHGRMSGSSILNCEEETISEPFRKLYVDPQIDWGLMWALY
jgi:hypothetical protein